MHTCFMHMLLTIGQMHTWKCLHMPSSPPSHLPACKGVLTCSCTPTSSPSAHTQVCAQRLAQAHVPIFTSLCMQLYMQVHAHTCLHTHMQTCAMGRSQTLTPLIDIQVPFKATHDHPQPVAQAPVLKHSSMQVHALFSWSPARVPMSPAHLGRCCPGA